jgi:hypothetical protein
MKRSISAIDARPAVRVLAAVPRARRSLIHHMAAATVTIREIQAHQTKETHLRLHLTQHHC